MRLLITGGAGAIGSNAARLALTRGHEVAVLDDLSSGFRDLVPAGARFVHGSIVDDDALTSAFDPAPDHVIHAAALFANQNSVEHPQADLSVNGLGLIKVLERCKRVGVRKLLFCSSSCVYGGKALMREDDLDLRPDTPYAITKWLGERYVRYWADQHGLDAVSVRLFNVYGPGERPGRYRNVIPNFIDRALRGDALVITGTGDETRDFTFTDDVVAGLFLALSAATEPGSVINLGAGRATSIRDLAAIVNEMTGNAAGVVYAPRRSWDHVPHRLCDPSLARRVFGFSATTELRDGLSRTVDWLRTHRRPPAVA